MGMTASRSESRASFRIGQQSYRNTLSRRHIETQPPIVRCSRTILPNPATPQQSGKKITQNNRGREREQTFSERLALVSSRKRVPAFIAAVA